MHFTINLQGLKEVSITTDTSKERSGEWKQGGKDMGQAKEKDVLRFNMPPLLPRKSPKLIVRIMGVNITSFTNFICPLSHLKFTVPVPLPIGKLIYPNSYGRHAHSPSESIYKSRPILAEMVWQNSSNSSGQESTAMRLRAQWTSRNLPKRKREACSSEALLKLSQDQRKFEPMSWVEPQL